MPTSRTSQFVFAAALIAGFGYLGVIASEGGWVQLLMKGLPVWLLALFALMNVRSADGWLLTIVMAFGALGDVLVERDLVIGALAFLVGHVFAMALYWRNRRAGVSGSQKALAWALIPLVPLIAWRLSGDLGTGLYSLFLAGMAALAWTSRFSRYTVGIGAMMFVVSDLLIFAQMGMLAGAVWPSYAIWLLYFSGQALIAYGVVSTLSADHQRAMRA